MVADFLLTSIACCVKMVSDDRDRVGRDGKMHDTTCKITMKGIAEATGQKLETVRRHHRDGWFDMADHKSVVLYTSAHMVLSGLEPKQGRRDEMVQTKGI